MFCVIVDYWLLLWVACGLMLSAAATLILGVVADIFSWGGLGSVGERLTFRSLLTNFISWSTLIVTGVFAAIGLLLSNI